MHLETDKQKLIKEIQHRSVRISKNKRRADPCPFLRTFCPIKRNTYQEKLTLWKCIDTLLRLSINLFCFFKTYPLLSSASSYLRSSFFAVILWTCGLLRCTSRNHSERVDFATGTTSKISLYVLPFLRSSIAWAFRSSLDITNLV